MAFARVKTIVTLRSRYFAVAPMPGMLFQRNGNSPIYRIVACTRLETAGDGRGHRYRISLERFDEAPPDGATIHPWWKDSAAAPEPVAEAPPEPEPDAVRIAVRAARHQAEREQYLRAGRVGRDLGLRGAADLGPGIQLSEIRGPQGKLLREQTVAVDQDAADPDAPQRRMRRARRIDPLRTLLKVHTIKLRHYDAGELLRQHVEDAEPAMAGGGLGEIHVDGSHGGGIKDSQLHACWLSRRALAAIGPREQGVVAWVVLAHGTVDGFARHIRRSHNRVSASFVVGMDALADHYFGPAPLRSFA